MFVNSLREAGQAMVEEFDISTLEGTRPINAHSYRTSPKEEAAAQAELDKMAKSGVVRPSRSPWNAPIIIVPKSDGSLRFCVDFRRLNDVTKKEVYPMPRIDRALEQLQGMSYFSTFDLASGYWQVRLNERSKELTAFSVPGRGHYEFNVVPMGATNAPAHFQRVMDLVLSGLAWSICLVYLDDVIIYAPTFEEHLQRLDMVLQRLSECKLVLKWSKCHFLQREIGFLGHLVSGGGIKPLPAKVAAIEACRPPRNVSEVRAFMGMVGHFRRFIWRCSARMEPLSRLTKRDQPWT